MKRSVTPEVRRRGLLDKVGFAMVDTDRQPELARQLMRGGSIPQLVMYRKTAQGWKKSRLVGAQSVSSVEAFIEQGLDDAVPVENAVPADKVETASITSTK
jgi:hypothetical protein